MSIEIDEEFNEDDVDEIFHKEYLRISEPFLTEEIIPKPILPHLFAGRVISARVRDEIQSKKTDHVKSEHLLKHVGKTRESVSVLLRALQDEGQGHIISKVIENGRSQLDTICPFRNIGCTFSGSDAAARREHEKNSASEHLAMLMKDSQKREAAKDQQLKEVLSKIYQLNELLDVAHRNIGDLNNTLERAVSAIEGRTEDILLFRHVGLAEATFHWLMDFRQETAGASAWKEDKVNSPSFFSHQDGYQMRIEVYPGGHKMGEGSHVSVYLALVPGPYDAQLEWPYSTRYKLSIIHPNKGTDITRVYNPCEEGPKQCWEKPTSEVNEGWGTPEFLAQTQLDEYLKEGRLLIIVKIL